MSKEEKMDRLRSIIGEIEAGKGESPEAGSEPTPTLSQTIAGGNGNIQVSGNNNTIVKK